MILALSKNVWLSWSFPVHDLTGQEKCHINQPLIFFEKSTLENAFILSEFSFVFLLKAESADQSNQLKDSGASEGFH